MSSYPFPSIFPRKIGACASWLIPGPISGLGYEATSQHQEKRTLMISGGTLLGLELFIVLQVSDVASNMQVFDSYVIIASPHVIIRE